MECLFLRNLRNCVTETARQLFAPSHPSPCGISFVMSKAKGIETSRKVWEHYIRGWRPHEIAMETGLSEAVVRGHISDAVKQAKAHRLAVAGDVVQRELEHLDSLERGFEADLLLDPVTRSHAVESILKIKQRRAKYLGLDKPEEVKHSLTLEDIVASSIKE